MSTQTPTPKTPSSQKVTFEQNSKDYIMENNNDVDNVAKYVNKAEEIVKKIDVGKYQVCDTFVETCRALELLIRNKDQTIKELENEIKRIKNGEEKMGLFYEQNNEIKKWCKDIIDIRKVLKGKVQEKNNVENSVKNLEEKYRIKCSESKIQPLSFEEWKKKKNPQQEKLRSSPKRSPSRLVSSIPNQSHLRRPAESPSSFSPWKKTEPKSIQEYQARKSVAEAALKNERRKHKKEINNLLSKLEFLKDEDSELDFKIKEKYIELENGQKKFSQRRNINITSAKTIKNKYLSE